MNAEQLPLEVDELRKRLQYLEAILPETCQLIDGVKQDWKAQGCWSEWDESVRERLAIYNLHLRGECELPAVGSCLKSTHVRLMAGERAQRALDHAARRLYEEAVRSAQINGVGDWEKTGPSMRDRFRSKVLAEKRFFSMTCDGAQPVLVRARQLTGEQLRYIFKTPSDCGLTLRRGGQPDQLITRDSVLEASCELLRFNTTFPTNGG